MTDPKGTWSDGGKVWEGEPTPAVGGEASERLDVIASWLMGEAFCADWHDDPDMGVRECMRIKALFIDRINEFVCDEIKRAQPASPLRGRELLDAAQKVVMRYPYVTEKEALEIAKAVLALPASPVFECPDCGKDIADQDEPHAIDCEQRAAAAPVTKDEVFDLLYENVELKVSDGLPEIVGYDKFVKALLDRSAVPEQPAADPVTRREETITKCLKIIGIHEFSARQGVRSAMGPKVRQQALAAEAALQAVAKDIRALSQDKRGPSTSGSPVFPGGTSDDLDIEPIEGAKP